jgi:CHAT domain-containing protein
VHEAGSGILAKGSTKSRAEEKYRAAARSLTDRIWDPVSEQLGKADRVFLVPDGTLNLVNFYALPYSDGSFWIERGPTVHILSAERDLVLEDDIDDTGSGILVLGGADFDLEGLGSDLAGMVDPDRDATAHWFRGPRFGCEEFKEVRFEPLPASAQEASMISSVWSSSPRRRGDVTHLTGSGANELQVKIQAPGKQVLHLATHGFFIGGVCPRKEAGTRGIGGLSPRQESSSRFARAENTLLLSGLALAGANHRYNANASQEDGILTAEEIASLNLSGVEWAVLSACDTGLGHIEESEGVLGLRRAFRVAGARTLIMSLWAVEDKATEEWMSALYHARIVRGMDSAQCVRQASLEVLESRRERGDNTHPFSWAGFVGAGDWR